MNDDGVSFIWIYFFMEGSNKQIQSMLNELCDLYTQADLSSLLNIPQGTISKIKSGKSSNFSFKKADAIRSLYLTMKQKTSAV